MHSITLADPRIELVNAASRFYQQGWMVGTAGNLSTRLPDGSFWITASGCLKGELTLDDFVRVYPDGRLESSANLKPSAETCIHQCIYALFPEAQACYHVHSVEANLVSGLAETGKLPLPSLEMLKGLGIWEENPCCLMSVFHNYLKVDRIADEIKERFSTTPPKIPALLIRNHGVTVWAESTVQARNYIEILEYVFRYMVAARKMG
ncbi:MAG: methylthioribulose 1-phosphate dehydratase [Nostocales cyanobacterium 94392]|nr:methylthioribulose 1-phosphate dehydratase [Nostocales cyanobacterium 94392]